MAKVAELRTNAAHKYNGILLEIVWGVIKNNLPVVKEQINVILSDITKD